MEHDGLDPDSGAQKREYTVAAQLDQLAQYIDLNCNIEAKLTCSQDIEEVVDVLQELQVCKQ